MTVSASSCAAAAALRAVWSTGTGTFAAGSRAVLSPSAHVAISPEDVPKARPPRLR